jgi:BolA protein
MGVIADRISSKLMEAFAPVAFDLVDESHLHAGHAGHDHRGESHFAVTLASAAFAGKSRVERQRMVYAVLAEELRDRVHALRMALKTPEEIEQ